VRRGKYLLVLDYVRPGVQGPAGRCWLKNVVARPVVDAKTVEGVKFKPASVRID
jgi:hypothetical protein